MEQTSLHKDPFLLFYTEVYISSIIFDSKYNSLLVVDWENAVTGIVSE